jgi:hypothetical protein
MLHGAPVVPVARQPPNRAASQDLGLRAGVNDKLGQNYDISRTEIGVQNFTISSPFLHQNSRPPCKIANKIRIFQKSPCKVVQFCASLPQSQQILNLVSRNPLKVM